ncbi:MAG: redox-sensing transcriptional repressor Rex [Phycisphaerae bacterium]|nr:redox-sensing transcriptional repressor Rex [Phycisphaerae bacterium]
MALERTVGRLTLYRRLLNEQVAGGVENLRSHQLAARAGVTAVQVRRDLMQIGYDGSPKRGYDVKKLLESLRHFLDEPGGQRVALLGVGNLGRALLSYFIGRRPHLSIVAAFDTDPQLSGRVIYGCRCHPLDELEDVLKAQDITVAIVAVPAVAAQELADRLVQNGVKGILNFAPIPLAVPSEIFVENIDLTMSLEKVAYFSREAACETACERKN